MTTSLGKALGTGTLLLAALGVAACGLPVPHKAKPTQSAPPEPAAATAQTAPAPRAPVTKVALSPPPVEAKQAELGSVYVVKKGDTVYGISRRFDVPVGGVIAHNGLSPPYALKIGQRLAIPVARQHVVAKKDTVYGISRRYGVPVRSVIDRNGLAPPYALRIGQKLLIPVLRQHTVAKGDTVYSISRRYGVDMTELVRLNGVAPPYTIKAKQTLVLPDTRPERTYAKAKSNAQVAKARPARPRPAAIPKPPPRAGSKFLWPVKGKIILGYGPKANGLHNDGINIKAPRGAPVRAADNGVVAYAGNELRGFGNLLLIKHSGGWVTAYAHADKVLVRRGDKVRRGQTIGRVGSTGNVASPQLHFEVRKGTRAVDPTRLLARQTAGLTQ